MKHRLFLAFLAMVLLRVMLASPQASAALPLPQTTASAAAQSLLATPTLSVPRGTRAWTGIKRGRTARGLAATADRSRVGEVGTRKQRHATVSLGQHSTRLLAGKLLQRLLLCW